jgi:putative multiple sugar transport system permease protein
MAFLANGLSLLGLDSSWVSIIRGLVLIAAVAFDVYNKTQGRPSITGLLLRGIGIGRKKGSTATEDAIASQPQGLDKPAGEQVDKVPVS